MTDSIKTSHTPLELKFDKQFKQLSIIFENQDQPFHLSYEFLRVHSPSAEVQGHRPEEAILQWGKKDVSIDKVESVGLYAIKPFFSDGHATGIFTWEYLFHLATHQDILWKSYLEKLRTSSLSREKK
jgi:DUF971 family protein